MEVDAHARARSISYISLTHFDVPPATVTVLLTPKTSQITGECWRCASPLAFKTILMIEEEFGIADRPKSYQVLVSTVHGPIFLSHT